MWSVFGADKASNTQAKPVFYPDSRKEIEDAQVLESIPVHCCDGHIFGRFGVGGLSGRRCL
jgi:hypothetical protein